ncbi:helix-turn-helix transcriptional regulator [uncultured Microbacterium sp.]|uniref:helix-turn-helix transcriptional regulator n=1 Tax=uncultured Microbacterium sp. TaxID=191216 RepID=UPI0028D0F5F9|nr:helix-turn-helix transcriptional regulator [uncultured Microbacterium sp.]
MTIEILGGILEDLLAHDLGSAPHVVARIVSEVTADPPSVRAVARMLDRQQRHGLRPLPSPLPMIESISAMFADLELAPRDRDILIATSMRLDDRLEPLLAFDGRTADDLATSTVSELLRIHAGRVRLADPRLAIWLRATTGAAEAARVHARLHRVFQARGEHVHAAWHGARASVHGVPEAATALMRGAQELSAAGANEGAMHLASEAAVHSSDAERDEATALAGVSAIAAGYAVEAVNRLGTLFPDGAESHRLRALGGMLIAQTHLQGAVPHVDPAALRPRIGELDHWHLWARAAAFAAVLCAERDDRDGMRSWIDALREGAGKTAAGAELRDPVVALAWLIAGDRDVDAEITGTGPLSGGMLRALRAALDGDLERALRVLAAGDSGIGTEVDPFVAGFERSPLVGAYRAIVEVLLLMWSGDIGTARVKLLSASMELPVAIPFAGLAAVIARRLDLAVLGRLGPFARSLTAVLPRAMRIDDLVDRGIEAFLAGSFEQAAACMRLWRDSGAPQTTLSVPGLEEAVLIGHQGATRRRRIEPPGISLAQELRARMLSCSDEEWRSERAVVVDAARTLSSPFTRGRVEAMIGARCLITGDVARAREHFDAARNLLEVSGAHAWARAVDARLTRLRTDAVGRGASGDPLAASRRIWEPMLTARELEVTMLAAVGASNREIAESLHVSVRTVEVHLGRVFAKLEVRSRVELTVLAHRIGQYV